MKKLLASLALLVATAPAWATPKTVTLTVEGMTCAACPITVNKALSKVAGVSNIDIQFETREVVVTFDDNTTNAQALTQATTDAGYPSTEKK